MFKFVAFLRIVNDYVIYYWFCMMWLFISFINPACLHAIFLNRPSKCFFKPSFEMLDLLEPSFETLIINCPSLWPSHCGVTVTVTVALNIKASGAQCFIKALGLFWDIVTGLPWTPNGVGSLGPRGYCIFLPGAHYLTINSPYGADSSLNKLLLLLLWPSGIGSRLGRNRLWVRFLAVSDIYIPCS